MDCSGFIYVSYRLFGITLPRTVKKLYRVGIPVDREFLEEADIVFFNGTEKPLHAGIYIGNGKFIHASPAAKRIRVDFLDSPWQFKHYIGAIRIRELKSPKETR